MPYDLKSIKYVLYAHVWSSDYWSIVEIRVYFYDEINFLANNTIKFVTWSRPSQ